MAVLLSAGQMCRHTAADLVIERNRIDHRFFAVLHADLPPKGALVKFLCARLLFLINHDELLRSPALFFYELLLDAYCCLLPSPLLILCNRHDELFLRPHVLPERG